MIRAGWQGLHPCRLAGLDGDVDLDIFTAEMHGRRQQCIAIIENADTYVFCGFYAAELKGLATGTQITMYATELSRITQTMAAFPSVFLADAEFGQLSIIEARDRTPWFNAEIMNGVRVVDDVELYLEMTIDTPRGPQVADVLQSRILGGFPRG